MDITIRLCDGHDLIEVTGLETVTAMATDGYFIPLERFAYEMDVNMDTAQSWFRRGNIEGITVFGKRYVKQGGPIVHERWSKFIGKVRI